jgi:hypothetical protein
MIGNAIILMLALTVAADPPAPPPSQSAERICRGGGQRSLGSHIRTRRRCLTAEEWQREDEARSRPAPGLQVTEGQNDGRAPVQPR